MVDESGGTLPITTFHAGGWSSRSPMPIEEGGTAVHAVSEDARVIRVLRRAGSDLEDIARFPLALSPGEVNVFRLDPPRSGRDAGSIACEPKLSIRQGLIRASERADPSETRGFARLGAEQVPSELEVHPESGRVAEKAGKRKLLFPQMLPAG